MAAALAFLAIPVYASFNAHDVVRGAPSARTLSVQRIKGELEDRIRGTSEVENNAIAEVIVDEAAVYGFDPLFVIAVIEAESKFEIEAVSKSGARGLMQVLPSTFKSVSDAPRMFDPVENVRAGVRYLGKLSSSYKRPDTLLLAYNAGPGGAMRILRGDKEHNEETSSYAPKVLKRYAVLLEKHGLDPKKMKTLYLAKR